MRTAQILNAYSHIAGNIVKVLYDETNTISLKYVQLSQQRDLYKNYGEVVLLDGTYNVDKLAMPLYTLLVEDNFGVGQPVAYFFIREETTEWIMEGLRIFAALVYLRN